MTEERKPQSADKYIIRFPDGMRDQIAEAAKKNGRSMNAEIILRLEHSFTPWKERPWEERMVIDVDRAMLKLLTKDEYSMLLDRVKAAGGADAVNGYARTVVRSVEDLQPPIPEGPRLEELIENLPPAESEKDEAATQLAIAVLRLTGRIKDDVPFRPVMLQTPRSGPSYIESVLKDIVDHRKKDADGNPIWGDAGTPSRTPTIPGKNAPKKGLGAAPKAEKPKKEKPVITKRKVYEKDAAAEPMKFDHTREKDE
jgi:hypothetical protein